MPEITHRTACKWIENSLHVGETKSVPQIIQENIKPWERPGGASSRISAALTRQYLAKGLVVKHEYGMGRYKCVLWERIA